MAAQLTVYLASGNRQENHQTLLVELQHKPLPN